MASNRFTNCKFNSCLFQSSSRAVARLWTSVHNSKAVLGVECGMSLYPNHIFYISPGNGKEVLIFFFHLPCCVSSPRSASALNFLPIQLYFKFLFLVPSFSTLLFIQWCVNSRIYFAQVRGNHAWNPCHFQVYKAIFCLLIFEMLFCQKSKS